VTEGGSDVVVTDSSILELDHGEASTSAKVTKHLTSTTRTKFHLHVDKANTARSEQRDAMEIRDRDYANWASVKRQDGPCIAAASFKAFFPRVSRVSGRGPCSECAGRENTGISTREGLCLLPLY
jgi:hypothetical protein